MKGKISFDIQSSTFIHNVAKYGGVFYFLYGKSNIASVEVTNSSFVENHALYGGVTYLYTKGSKNNITMKIANNV